MLVPRSSYTRRSEKSSIISIDDFVESINCRIISPILIDIEDRDTFNPLIILRVGFKIKLPVGAFLSWIRFQVIMLGREGQNNQFEKIKIYSFIPQRITQDTVLGGRIIAHDDGTLEREQVHSEDAGGSKTTFIPYSLGYKISTSHIIWDFLPFDGTSPTSTDKLVLSVKALQHSELQLSQSLQLCINHQTFGTLNFEYPTEVEVIKAKG